MKILALSAALGLCITAISGAANAHHSYSSFDLRQVVEIKGTVKEFHYTNPHTLIVLFTKDASGKDIQVFIEANGPGYLVRTGWNRNSLQVGDNVTITVNPMRDGTPGGSLVKVTFPDGRELKTH